jgi:farnesyl diphosphate synthase
MNLQTDMIQIANEVDSVLRQMLPDSEFEGDPYDVARYSAIDAGKRVRAYLTVQCANLFDVPREAAIRTAAAIELVHNFSLIHDDLPCIDNDTLRRGKPSAWAKFGEFQALLGGDYLLARAFGTLADLDMEPGIKLKLIKILSEMTCGMIHGEFMDIKAETGIFNTEEDVRRIQCLKTGRIFKACAMFGATLGNTPVEVRAALEKYIDAFGLCFQVTDDILDEIGDQEIVGKTVRKDAAAGKATFISLRGLEGAKEMVVGLAAEAKSALAQFDRRADGLRELADFLVIRKH